MYASTKAEIFLINSSLFILGASSPEKPNNKPPNIKRGWTNSLGDQITGKNKTNVSLVNSSREGIKDIQSEDKQHRDINSGDSSMTD